MPANFTNKNTVVYAVFNRFNSAVRLKPAIFNRTFTSSQLHVGEVVTLLSISYIDNKLYYTSHSITITPNKIVFLQPQKQPITVEKLTEALDSL